MPKIHKRGGRYIPADPLRGGDRRAPCPRYEGKGERDPAPRGQSGLVGVVKEDDQLTSSA